MVSLDNQTKEEQLSLKLFVVLSRSLESVKKQVVKDIKSYGLNLTEFGVMEYLYHKGEQPIQIIGKKVLLASSSITYVVDKLEEKQFIERIACPKDRRVIYGRLTEKGSNLMDEIFPKHEQAMATIFSSLTNEEKEQAIVLLKKIGLFADSI
ncbi:MarR family winged helix-turn-helix transcriptional regulator [Pseudogracilibacillus auburnensis]|uniref:MarR family 2-MHQ and catechol resistance regulon transcriptional repressor n=1 Tax=Pseudogracilibacillus auburnensis TaxID=1494959 RepID=A0A2V3WA14_9BACI|nr:MarR family transcriptional regulator [Pseudogracilibacillus auburnensis]MBO1004693.1 MarR family transcriptional regulator [Pseudogracilibacillus auburnensis]PXW85599.1 MarR family 2-MHQ and catechol resistance regulon transcriptional repressor [Pseudogracilibacillus auburnensis]